MKVSGDLSRARAVVCQIRFTKLHVPARARHGTMRFSDQKPMSRRTR
jgi:hypothetical protein